MVKKESLPDRPKFCRSGSAVRHLFWWLVSDGGTMSCRYWLCKTDCIEINRVVFYIRRDIMWPHNQMTRQQKLTTAPILAHLAPFPLTIFWSNSKFYQNLQCSSLKCTLPTTTKFCTRHDSVTVVTCAKCCCDWLSIFETRALPILIEFDRNIVSGTGARSTISPGRLTAVIPGL